MALFILVVLIVVNSLLVISEIAIVSSRKVRLEQMAERGVKGASAALKLANEPTRFLATGQIGITLVGILSGAIGEASIAEHLREYFGEIEFLKQYSHALATITMIIVIGFVSTLLGELLPKRLGLINPERVASIVAAPMNSLSRLATPAVVVLGASCDLILKILRIPLRQESVTEEEIKGMIAKGAETGVFHEQEHEIVERVFRFADLRVRALMVPRNEIDWIDASADISMVRTIITASPHSHFLVCDASLDKLVGVIHVKDLVKIGVIAGESVKVSELATTPLFVPDATKAIKVLDLFRDTGQHMAVVVDEFGGIEGIITLNDLLEAIVGEVSAGGLPIEAAAVRREDGSWLIDAAITVQEFRSTLELPQDAFSSHKTINTLAGLVQSLMGRVPRTGDRVTDAGVQFEIVDMDGRRIDKVLVTPVPPVSDADSAASEGARE